MEIADPMHFVAEKRRGITRIAPINLPLAPARAELRRGTTEFRYADERVPELERRKATPRKTAKEKMLGHESHDERKARVTPSIISFSQFTKQNS